MTGVTIERFDEYFRELHGCGPYSWQQRLAQRAVAGDWPGAIDLPTGSGKTACIDIAIFALACQACRPVIERTAPRRVFFCVNRRVIVDEAHQRAMRIAKALWDAERNPSNDKTVVHQVAAALRTLSGTALDDDTPPLDVLELRGGIYRDNRWARSVTQPTIVCTTIDQLGSRLLFRGYGVSSNAAPIQAALIAYDSLILLDEAHISEPFRQTLEHVHRYLDSSKWVDQAIGVRSVCVVPMTATPPEGLSVEGVVRLDAGDRTNPSLGNRLKANKWAEQREVKDIADEAVKAATKLAHGKPTAVGIIVNRVATAKEIHKKLREHHSDAVVELVIGSMRPIDRDEQFERLRSLVGRDRPAITERTCFIVATQCLEVGADYDFDALVTECASLDALRQRFGRLNRGGRSIGAEAVIVARKREIMPDEKLDDGKPLDPIYGNALARTWNWLVHHGKDGFIDFGIDALTTVLQEHGGNGRIPPELLAPSASLNAPVMLPSYVDFWCQTAPRPMPDPDISLFLHGPQRGEPDVQVCWRADLGDTSEHPPADLWCDVVALLPPTSAECMSVPISRLRRWLIDEDSAPTSDGDLLGVAAEESAEVSRDRGQPALKHRGLLWRGAKDSCLLTSADELRPGDTLVLPQSAEGWEILGHLPRDASDDEEATDHARIDRAEAAFVAARNRIALRVHPTLRFLWPKGAAIDALFDQPADPDDRPTIAELGQLLRDAAGAIGKDEWRRSILEELSRSSNLLREDYPDGQGAVLMSRQRFGLAARGWLPALDDGDDESSRTRRDTPVTLTNHTAHVREALGRALSLLPTKVIPDALHVAVRLHDLGKADERFQTLLHRADRTDAWLRASVASPLLAKSDGMPQTRAERDAARKRASLPDGFRHEMLSVKLAERSDQLPGGPDARDLVLHLIAAHHGRARPFAPVVIDNDPPDVDVDGLRSTRADRLACPPHRLDSGIATRFWSLTRRFGWWGLAYLEAILRLADQQASAAEDAGKYVDVHTGDPAEITA